MLLAAWLMALGGLHVTQSHFFLADVPAVTLTMLAVWLVWRDLTISAANDHEALRWAAFSAAAAFAFKLFVFALPALAYAVFVRTPATVRAVHAAVFGIAGLTVFSLGFETPESIYMSITEGIKYDYEFDRVRGALLYLVQLPSLLAFPLLLAGVAGTWGLVARLRRLGRTRRRHALMVFGSVPLIGLAFVLLKLDHFPRHLVFVIPWAAIAGGWFLARVTERLPARQTALALGAVFVWMFAVVVDSERYFIFDPRNDALRWIRSHVPEVTTMNWMGKPTPRGYRTVRWFVHGEPEILIIEMAEANNSLSGVNWRNSYPTDVREVFDGRSPERVAAIQALFRGTSGYTEVARFSDPYIMPEYRLAMAALGDRSRSYITEVVIFERRGTGIGSASAAGRQ